MKTKTQTYLIDSVEEEISQLKEAFDYAKIFDPKVCDKAQAENDFPAFLKSSMWNHIRQVGKYWVGIYRYMFTHAIVAIEEGDYISPYTRGCRWCYHSEQAALDALNKWDEKLYQDQPEDWHRHPDSGRRRKYDDTGKFEEEIRY